jgi:uncharacterized damage-inducible protein DinB
MTKGCHSDVMGEPITPLPTDEAPTADERTTLMAFIDYQRAVLARKLEGLSEEQARMEACPPSDLTLIGLVRHMADVERSWFRRGLLAEDASPIFYGDAHPDGDRDGDFHAPPGATVAEALSTYWAEIEVANRNAAAASLNDIERREPGTYSLRWILVHMVEEYARHCGHADLLRQAIDGTTGD